MTSFPTPTLIDVTSLQQYLNGATLTINSYTCPSTYPHLVNWKLEADSSTATASEFASGGNGSSDDPNWFKALLGGGFTGANVGVRYICSSLWPPSTADCGGEGQRDCWGAVLTPIENWQRADFMFTYGGSGLCDHALVGGANYYCTSATRHRLNASSWEDWALDNQRYGVSAKEPMNWFTTLGSHESFNTRADTYTFPNHTDSISDQLTWGARYIDLRARWISDYLRLSHTSDNNSIGGGSAADRAFPYAIEEIGTWLEENPGQVIRLDIGVGYSSAGAPSYRYITDPLDKYLGDRILTPSAWCHYLKDHYPTIARPYPFGSSPDDCTGVDAGEGYTPYRWPTMDEFRALGKQVIITTNGGSLDKRLAFEPGYTGNDLDGEAGYTNGFARQFDGADCTRNGKAYLFNSDASEEERDYFNRATTTEEEARVYGEATFAYSSWTGYLVADQADKNKLAGTVAVDHGDQATSMEEVTRCNVGLMKLDEFGTDGDFDSEVTFVSGLGDRRRGAIWSWAVGDYGTNGGPTGDNCAALGGSDDRWHSRGCGEVHHFACARRRSGDPTTWPDVLQEGWKVTTGTGAWAEGTAVCDSEFGAQGYAFSSPRNGRANQKLLDARDAQLPGGADLWLSYSDAGGRWHAGAPPVVTTGALANGWVNHDVVVQVSGQNQADPTTQITHITYDLTGAQSAQGSLPGGSGTLTVSSEGITTVDVQAIDAEGNVSTPLSFDVRIDETPPAISAAPDRAANLYGWYDAPVMVAFTCADQPQLSGLAGCSAAVVLAADGANQSASGTATDNAGNSASTSLGGINIDQTPPVTSAIVTGTVGTNGWFMAGSPVVLTLSATDALSGVLSTRYQVNGGAAVGYVGPATFTDGLYTVAYGSEDLALNMEAQGSTTFQVDQTPPTVTFTGNAGAYEVDQTVTIACVAADNLSGVASSTCQDIDAPAYTFTAGSHVDAASAVDNAGNGGSGSTTFSVAATAASLCHITELFSSNQAPTSAMCRALTDGRIDVYLHMVEARLQSGQITADQAATLTYFAQNL